jgi:magnesium transporter
MHNKKASRKKRIWRGFFSAALATAPHNYNKLHSPTMPSERLPARRPHLRLHPLGALPSSADAPAYTLFSYNAAELQERVLRNAAASAQFKANGHIVWINVDGLRADEVGRLCALFGIHPLMAEDVLSRNERPKMEESGELIFCVLPQMFYDEAAACITLEQVSIVLGKNFVMSFQEEKQFDVFDSVRSRLRDPESKLRQREADYLVYNLLDVIVDSYFDVLEKLALRLEALEEGLIRTQTNQQLAQISVLRRDVATVRRAVLPVRELVAHFVRSDSELLAERNEKYFRDVLDHAIQANDFIDAHRDSLMNLQDLYMNQINLRMNEVMKVFTLLATLMAPATVIGGIFGMNFIHMPLLHARYGFDVAVLLMLGFPALMIFWFKRKGWF